MAASLKRTIVLVLLVTTIYGGFRVGRQIGMKGSRRPVPVLNNLSRLLSANAANGAVGDADTLGHENDSAVPPVTIFEQVLEKVQHEFVEPADNNARLSTSALARMFGSLDDPRSYFMEPAMRQARQEALQGRFQGVGAALAVTRSQVGDVDYRRLTVVDVMAGSPAEKAGLRAGDRITELDGRWIIAYAIAVEVERLQRDKRDDAIRRAEARRAGEKFQKGLTAAKALKMLTTGQGTRLLLTVERPGLAAPFKLEMTTAATEVDPVEFRIVRNRVGYLRIRQFNARATHEFQTALNDLGSSLKGLIVDLRQNPGGVRSENLKGADGYASALKLLERLTPGGNVALLETRPGQREPVRLPVASRRPGLPVVVLVDGGTANLSEMAASALRSSAKARIVGTHTFGDNVLSLFTVLKNGAGIEITTARLFSSAGASLEKGVVPDVVVRETGSGGHDLILERALSLLGV